MKRVANHRNAGGVPEISRGLKRAALIPPDRSPRFPSTLKGCQNRIGHLREIVLAPFQGADVFLTAFRGYRCAQPPANFLHPSGMPPSAALRSRKEVQP